MYKIIKIIINCLQLNMVLCKLYVKSLTVRIKFSFFINLSNLNYKERMDKMVLKGYRENKENLAQKENKDIGVFKFNIIF